MCRNDLHMACIHGREEVQELSSENRQTIEVREYAWLNSIVSESYIASINEE